MNKTKLSVALIILGISTNLLAVVPHKTSSPQPDIINVEVTNNTDVNFSTLWLDSQLNIVPGWMQNNIPVGKFYLYKNVGIGASLNSNDYAIYFSGNGSANPQYCSQPYYQYDLANYPNPYRNVSINVSGKNGTYSMKVTGYAVSLQPATKQPPATVTSITLNLTTANCASVKLKH